MFEIVCVIAMTVGLYHMEQFVSVTILMVALTLSIASNTKRQKSLDIMKTINEKIIKQNVILYERWMASINEYVKLVGSQAEGIIDVVKELSDNNDEKGMDLLISQSKLPTSMAMTLRELYKNFQQIK